LIEQVRTRISYLFANECTSDCLKNNIKIDIKIAPTCLGATTPKECDINTSRRTLAVYAATTPLI